MPVTFDEWYRRLVETAAGKRQGHLPFGGETYEPVRDSERLGQQLRRVRELMSDGKWRSLEAISEAVSAPTASVSARLRDLRKLSFGAHDVQRRHVGSGLWVYRVVPDEKL